MNESTHEELLAEEPSFDTNKEYTYADYLQFRFEEMVELIRGKLFRMSPAPKIAHQTLSLNLALILGIYFKNARCRMFVAPTDVVLPVRDKKREKATTVVQPDLIIVCDPSIIEEKAIFGVPDLLVEILSPHTRKKDIKLKYDVYEEAGVKEYWIVTPESLCVEVFFLEDGKYQRINTYVEDEIFTPVLFPDLKIDLTEVFKDVKRD